MAEPPLARRPLLHVASALDLHAPESLSTAVAGDSPEGDLRRDPLAAGIAPRLFPAGPAPRTLPRERTRLRAVQGKPRRERAVLAEADHQRRAFPGRAGRDPDPEAQRSVAGGKARRAQEPARAVHRALPFARLPAQGRIRFRRAFVAAAEKTPAQELRWRDPERRHRLFQVSAKERVEDPLLIALVVVAVPPEPVAPLRRVKRLPRRGRRLRPPRAQQLPRPSQRVPRGVLLGMPDPDRQVVADPGADRDFWQR